jgi:hypothetical protein
MSSSAPVLEPQLFFSLPSSRNLVSSPLSSMVIRSIISRPFLSRYPQLKRNERRFETNWFSVLLIAILSRSCSTTARIHVPIKPYVFQSCICRLEWCRPWASLAFPKCRFHLEPKAQSVTCPRPFQGTAQMLARVRSVTPTRTRGLCRVGAEA